MKAQAKRPTSSKKSAKHTAARRSTNSEFKNQPGDAMSPSTGADVDTTSDQTNLSVLDNTTLWWSLLSAVLLPIPVLWADYGWVAWLAPIGWLHLINRPKLDGKRPYRMLALTSYVHWLLMTYWVTLPHPATSLGWLALSAYLTIYLVGFIGLARWLVHRANWPSIVAAPIAWVAMEFLRSYLFTGFALCSLSHSQVNYVPLLQIAKFTGAYGVSFLVMFGAAGVERAITHFRAKQTRAWFPLLLPTAAVVLALSFGFWCTSKDNNLTTTSGTTTSEKATARVAIIQGSLDTEFDGDMSKLDDAFKHYTFLTEDVTSKQEIDLVIWPESMFRLDIVRFDEALRNQEPEPGFYSLVEWSEFSTSSTKKLVGDFGTTCLLGTGTVHYHEDSVERYNTAALFNSKGQQIGEYHKMHPVMFGEYIPLGDVFPWIYNFTPIPGGLNAGTKSEAFAAANVSFVPSICFENTVPHLIRNQVLEVTERNETADVLVTLTNDGWFWGSALLDLHLACGICRAVENGLPMLIAANTGFSAHIDSNGRVLQKGPRRAAKVLVADVQKLDRRVVDLTFYTRYGDLFAMGTLLCGCLGLVVGWYRR